MARIRKAAKELGAANGYSEAQLKALVTGTGPQGNITKDDVQAFLDAQAQPPVPPRPPPPPPVIEEEEVVAPAPVIDRPRAGPHPTGYGVDWVNCYSDPEALEAFAASHLIGDESLRFAKQDEIAGRVPNDVPVLRLQVNPGRGNIVFEALRTGPVQFGGLWTVENPFAIYVSPEFVDAQGNRCARRVL